VGLLEPARVAGGPGELDEPARDIRVVLQVAGNPRLAGAIGPQEPPALVRELCEEELGHADSRVHVVGPIEAGAGLRERGEREPVPRGQCLVVPKRLRSPLALGEQLGARLLRDLVPEHEAPVLEGPEPLGMRLAEHRLELLVRPREREALDTVGVRVLRRGEPALG